MKVYIQNATGSQKAEAMLDKDSGVIEFKNGEISHVLFEKQSGKTIFAYEEGVHCKLVKKEEPKVEAKEEVKEEASPEQSKEGNKKKTKTK